MKIDTTDILPVLEAMDSKARVIIVEAPPGAGKTMLVSVAVAHVVEQGMCPLFMTISYEQIYGAIARLKQVFPKIQPVVFASADRKTKDDAKARSLGFTWASKWNELAPFINQNRPVFTVVAKAFSSPLGLEGSEHIFPWIILDEAFQITDADFSINAALGDRFLMVGDRGQIQPIVKTDIQQWRNDDIGPHLSAPEAIMKREHLGEDRVKIPMTMSRRLPQRSVDLVQTIFYPTLPFTGSKERRELNFPETVLPNITQEILARSCGSDAPGFIPVLLPGAGRKDATDISALEHMAQLTDFICENRLTIITGNKEREATPEDVVLLVTRNNERRWLQQRLAAWPGVTIATANKFQGSERPIVLALHPLSGKTRASDFDLESGRLCVMLSRHTHACFVFHREGISELLERKIPNSARALGSEIDHAFAGWRAHRTFMAWIENSGHRIIFENPELVA